MRASLSFLLLVWMEFVPPNITFVLHADLPSSQIKKWTMFVSKKQNKKTKKKVMQTHFAPLNIYLD